MSNLLTEKGRNMLQTMSTLIRYNNKVHFHQENVAEHSYYVSLYTMLICKELRLAHPTTYVAMKMALIHDVHEVLISDIPHNVKKMLPEINDACKKFEEVFNMQNFGEEVNEFVNLNKKEQNIINLVVNIADVLSVLQYAGHEIDRENYDFFEVHQNAEVRITDDLENLKNYVDEHLVKSLKNTIFKQFAGPDR